MKNLLLLTLLCLTTLPAFSQKKLPAEIRGNWLHPQNNYWEYGFYDHFAMADGAFWNYDKIVKKGNRITLFLKNDTAQKQIAIKPLPKGNLKIKETGRKTIICTKQWNENPDFAHYDTTGFQSPILRMDSVYLTGFISGYNFQQDSFRFVRIIYDPLLEENQRNFIAQIDSLGRFHISFPLLNPQEVMLKYDHTLISFYGFPGKKLTLGLDPKDIRIINNKRTLLFSNTTGLFNTERHGFINQLHRRSFNSLDRKKTHSLEEEAYKQFRTDSMKAQLELLNQYANKHHNSKKLIQYAKTYIQYWTANDLLRYRWLHYGLNKDSVLSNTYLSFLQELQVRCTYIKLFCLS